MAKEKTATAEVEEKPYNPMKDMVTVRLPRATGREEEDVKVSLNGKLYRIQRGAQVRLPRPVYDILVESERQKERQAAYERELQEKARNSAPQIWR